MKARIITLIKTFVFMFLCAISTSPAFADGMIYFDGYSIDDGSMPPGAKDFKVTLYYGTSPGLGQTGPTVKNDWVGSYSGNSLFPGDPITLPPPYYPGAWVYVQVKAWKPSTYSTYAAAVASGDPSVKVYASPVGYYQLGWDYSSAPLPTEFSYFTLSSVAPPTGSLQVTISPAGAVSAGAQWGVDYGMPRNSGTTVSGLSAGSHTVVFSTVPGWITPATQTVNINANQTTAATGTYVTKSAATVILSNLLQIYDGTAKRVSVATSPSGLIVNVTYNGSVNAPTNVGNYTAIGTISDGTYQGSATNTLAIVVPDNSTNVIAAQSATLASGQSATASTAPAGAGQAGVTATATNGGGTSNLMVVVANYATQPAGVPVFQAGASYMDIRVWDADTNDLLSANFYYPSTITGSAEANLALNYWDGANWSTVRSSGGSLPAKDTTDNLAGTVSGGRFTVAFDTKSTPTLMGLTGTVFALAPVIVASTPPQLTATQLLLNGAFQFGFTNTPGASFSAYSTTNLSVAFSNWTALGSVTEISPGQFLFSDPQATNGGQHFYRIRSP